MSVCLLNVCLTCEDAHSWRLYSSAPLRNQATSTVSWYPTQLHYPETEPTSPCPILIMPSNWLVSDMYQFYKSLVWLDYVFELMISHTRDPCSTDCHHARCLPTWLYDCLPECLPLPVHLFVYLPVCLPVKLPPSLLAYTCPSLHRCLLACMTAYPPACLFACLLVSLPVFMIACMIAYLSTCLYDCLHLWLLACLYVCLLVCLYAWCIKWKCVNLHIDSKHLANLLFNFCLERYNLVYLTSFTKILLDIVVHIKMMFWTCLF